MADNGSVQSFEVIEVEVLEPPEGSSVVNENKSKRKRRPTKKFAEYSTLVLDYDEAQDNNVVDNKEGKDEKEDQVRDDQHMEDADEFIDVGINESTADVEEDDDDVKIKMELDYDTVKKGRGRGKLKKLKTESKVKQDKSIICDICGNMYKNKTILSKHKLKHAGVKFPCKHCGALFSDESSVTRHEKNHVMPRSFVCDVCGKVFSDISNLYQHQRIHTGKKEFACERCDHTFSRREHLKVHMVRHTGERPYKCYVCDYTFTQSSPRVSHMQNIHKISYVKRKGRDGVIKCHVCDKPFEKLEDAVDHVKSEHITKTMTRDFNNMILENIRNNFDAGENVEISVPEDKIVYHLVEVPEEECVESDQQYLILGEDEDLVFVYNEDEDAANVTSGVLVEPALVDTEEVVSEVVDHVVS